MPVSPWRITGTSIGATRFRSENSCRIFTPWPTIPESSTDSSGETSSASAILESASGVGPESSASTVLDTVPGAVTTSSGTDDPAAIERRGDYHTRADCSRVASFVT